MQTPQKTNGQLITWRLWIATDSQAEPTMSISVIVLYVSQVIPLILDLDVIFKKKMSGAITPVGDTSMTMDLHAHGCSLLLKYFGTSLSYSR